MAAQDLQTPFEKIEEQNMWIIRMLKPRYEAFMREYVPKAGDVVVASFPKTGSTWTKALVHSVMACGDASVADRLNNESPHAIVPFLEMKEASEWRDMPSPRLMSTHIPFHALPTQMRDSTQVKFIYVTRNPRDALISWWKYIDRLAENPAYALAKGRTIGEALESFCAGECVGGPFQEHVLGYYKESLRCPERVLLLSYEDMLSDCETAVCKIGVFLGYPSHVIHENARAIAERCSFERLSNIPANKVAVFVPAVLAPPSVFFRNGRSGEWKDYFTPEMQRRFEEEVEQRLKEGGVCFSY